MLPSMIAISLGAALGALGRWGLGLWLGVGLMSWGTLAANLVGGYLIGAMVAVFQAMPGLDPVWRLAIITGFLGGLTTFSSFSAEVVILLIEGRVGVAALTTLTHLAGSFLLTWLGFRMTQYVLA
ncbi:hypothetical protein BH11PSE13_BH11PSE13_39010 [soil metagenome]